MKIPKMEVPKRPGNVDPWHDFDSLQYEIEVVTPIMGGGAEANKAEECFAVRPSEIRGHLRFWWRELFGKDVPDGTLRSLETNIWGDAKTPSSVRVEVEGAPFCAKRMKSQDNFGFRRFSRESYALFPLDSVSDCSIVKEGGKFTCKIMMKKSLTEEQKSQVKQSVDAWILLGGVGARTRRGLGCLRCDSVDGIILDKFRIFTDDGGSNPMKQWADGLGSYKAFRQLRREGQEKKRPGRSFWPEAESCRKVTCQRLPKHQSLGDQLDGLGAVDGEFTSPRAALGLPIIIHFKDHKFGKDPEDPEDVMVNVDGKEGRMGSPVIVKPLFKDGSWRSAFIFLRNSAEEALGSKRNSVGAFGKQICSKEGVSVKVLRKNAIPAGELKIQESADVIVALQQYLEKKGYKKIGGAK